MHCCELMPLQSDNKTGYICYYAAESVLTGSSVARDVWQWTHCNDVHSTAVARDTRRRPVSCQQTRGHYWAAAAAACRRQVCVRSWVWRNMYSAFTLTVSEILFLKYCGSNRTECAAVDTAVVILILAANGLRATCVLCGSVNFELSTFSSLPMPAVG